MLDGKQIINGTFGECWVEDNYIDTVTAVEIKISREFSDIKIPRNLMPGFKEISRSGEGKVTFSHLDSMDFQLLGKAMQEGKQESVTIISKLADPNAMGEERVVVRGCVFPELTLANWKAATAGEKELSFKFNDYEIINQIERR